jgi:hypothetical protein
MAGALFTVVAGGMFLTGCLFHFGHPFYAVGSGLAAYALTRWIWTAYTD